MLERCCSRGSATVALLLSSVIAHAQSAVSTVPPIDACALLSPADIRGAVALEVAGGERRDDGLTRQGAYSSSCVWEIKYSEPPPVNLSAPLGGRHFIILNAMQWPVGQDLAGTYLEAFRGAAQGGDLPQQPAARDFGDEALWWGDGLAARQGDVSFGLSVFIPGKRAQLGSQLEERLAPLILQRLSAPSAALQPSQ